MKSYIALCVVLALVQYSTALGSDVEPFTEFVEAEASAASVTIHGKSPVTIGDGKKLVAKLQSSREFEVSFDIKRTGDLLHKGSGILIFDAAQGKVVKADVPHTQIPGFYFGTAHGNEFYVRYSVIGELKGEIRTTATDKFPLNKWTSVRFQVTAKEVALWVGGNLVKKSPFSGALLPAATVDTVWAMGPKGVKGERNINKLAAPAQLKNVVYKPIHSSLTGVHSCAVTFQECGSKKTFKLGPGNYPINFKNQKLCGVQIHGQCTVQVWTKPLYKGNTSGLIKKDTKFKGSTWQKGWASGKWTPKDKVLSILIFDKPGLDVFKAQIRAYFADLKLKHCEKTKSTSCCSTINKNWVFFNGSCGARTSAYCVSKRSTSCCKKINKKWIYYHSRRACTDLSHSSARYRHRV